VLDVSDIVAAEHRVPVVEVAALGVCTIINSTGALAANTAEGGRSFSLRQRTYTTKTSTVTIKAATLPEITPTNPPAMPLAEVDERLEGEEAEIGEKGSGDTEGGGKGNGEGGGGGGDGGGQGGTDGGGG